MGLTITADDGTLRLFDVVVWCLQRYCGYSEEDAVDAVNKFYERFRGRYDDEYYHHQAPYRVAMLIYYVDKLSGTPDDFIPWLLSSDYRREPPDPEYVEYFRKHYWQGHLYR